MTESVKASAERWFSCADVASVDVQVGGCDALYVGVAGNLSFIDAKGTTVTALPVDKGFFPARCRTVVNSGTTASSIYAVWW